jgi:hypothetical protein
MDVARIMCGVALTTSPAAAACCFPAVLLQFGTLSHMPPCLLREGRLTTRADVYAFAMVMWQLFTVSGGGMEGSSVVSVVWQEASAAMDGTDAAMRVFCQPGWTRDLHAVAGCALYAA